MFRDIDKKKLRRRWLYKNILWIFILAVMGGTAYYLFIPFVQQVKQSETSKNDVNALDKSSKDAHENIIKNKAHWFKVGSMADAYQLVDSLDKVSLQGGWFNTAPLDINYLLAHGHYILLYFWSASNIESIRANKYIEWLWQSYKDSGLVIIGIHVPNFQKTGNPEEVYDLIKKQGLTFPILLDGHKKIWNKLHVYTAPTQYLLNPKSKVIYSYVGEGNYEQETAIIREHLTMAGWLQKKQKKLPKFFRDTRLTTTQKLLTGYDYKRRLFGNKNQGVRDKPSVFTIDSVIEPDRIYLNGNWTSRKTYLESNAPGEIIVNFLGAQSYAYFESLSPGPLLLKITLDGSPVSPVVSGNDIQHRADQSYLFITNVAKLYQLTNKQLDYGRHELMISVPKGVRFYSLSFPEQ